MFSGLSNWWENLTPRGRTLVGMGLVVAVFVVPALVMFIYQSIYSAKITLTFAPKSATARIGDSGGSFGDNAVKPGTYEVVISKKGFTTYKETVTVASGKPVLVEAALESNDPSTANWYQEHEDDYSIAQGIGDRRADRAYKKMTASFPIAKDLPIIGLYSTYRIDYGLSPSDKNSYAIFISSETDEYKQQAIDRIESKGYELKDYEVIYSQSTPDVYGTTSLTGFSTFSARGLSSDVVDLISRTVAEHFVTYEGQPVTSINMSSEVLHTMSDDRTTDTYTANVSLNGQNSKKLIITLRNYSNVTIQVSALDGSATETLFSGETS